MKRKSILAVLMAAIMALSTVTVFALDYAVPEDATSTTARFFLEGQDASQVHGDEFSMVSEDGELTINITEDTIIYFEDFVPLSDECDGLTQMVREVLFGRTLAEVLDGRNMRVLFVEGDETEVVSIKVLFETAVHLPIEIDPVDLLQDGEYIGIVTLPGEIDLDDFDGEYIGIVTLPGEIDLGDFDGEYIGIVTLPGEIDLGDFDGEYIGIVTLPGEIDLGDFDGEYIGIVTLPGEIDSEMLPFTFTEAPPMNGQIVVNGVMLENVPHPFWQQAEVGGSVMVPLRAVAEALGFDISWNGLLQSIQLGVAIHLWIDNTEIHIGRMAPQELSTAPILVNDITFVPIDFFRILGETVYVFEGQVVVATYSDMR